MLLKQKHICPKNALINCQVSLIHGLKLLVAGGSISLWTAIVFLMNYGGTERVWLSFVPSLGFSLNTENGLKLHKCGKNKLVMELRWREKVEQNIYMATAAPSKRILDS